MRIFTTVLYDEPGVCNIGWNLASFIAFFELNNKMHSQPTTHNTVSGFLLTHTYALRRRLFTVPVTFCLSRHRFIILRTFSQAIIAWMNSKSFLFGA